MNRPSVTLRLTTPDDAPALAPILLEMYEFYGAAPKETSEQELLDYVRKRLFSPYSGIRLVAAFMDDKLVGFASFSLLYPAVQLSGQMFMKDLFVSREARGHKVGQLLMKFLAQLALAEDCIRLDWTAETSNSNAIEFYRALGAECQTEKRYFRFAGESLRHFAEAPPV